MRRVIPMVVLATSVAHAQVPPTKAAEETFARGRELMKQKKFAEACQAFEQSQRLDPQYGTQYNLAGCYVELGKLASAWNVYRELSRSDNNPDRKRASTDAAAKLAARVPKLLIALPARPDGTTLTLDGADALVLVGVETPVDLGTHAIVAAAPGHRTVNQAIVVKNEGKTIPVTIELVPGTGEVTPPPPVATTPGDPMAPSATPSKRPLIGKVAIIGGGAIAVTGLVFGGLAYGKWNDAKAAMDNDLVDKARTYGNLSTGFVVAGLAVAAAGAVIWLTAPDEHSGNVAIAPTFDPSAASAGLAIGGAF